MQLSVLGSDGGIGNQALTSAFLNDETIMIDCGTGAGALSLDAMSKVDHVFITHAHMDHIACLGLMADSMISYRKTPIKVYGTAVACKSLRDHVINNVVWPDFTKIPTPETPVLEVVPIDDDATLTLGDRQITTLPVDHHGGAVGYAISNGLQTLAITGDTGLCSELFASLDRLPDLKTLIIEASFPDDQAALADLTVSIRPIPQACWFGRIGP